MTKIRLPWFRVHIVLLSDPGRLIATHLMHTGLIAGWAGVMTLYELIVLDPTDPVYNPLWRQGSYVLPFVSRLGVTQSIYGWSLGLGTSETPFWAYETVALSHIVLAGLLTLSSCWHWAYWDLDLFVSSLTGKLILDLNRLFGIHLLLASLLCLGFGALHLTGFGGPGFWSSDSFGIIGSIRSIKPTYSLVGLTSFCYGSISAHHISAGLLGLFAGLWHISSRPSPSIFKLVAMSNIESVLASSIAAVFFTTLIVASSVWYGSPTIPLELFGPTRYQWDNGYFSLDLERRVKSVQAVSVASAWEQIPDKLTLYDYIGSNPAKGGLFRSGPLLKGDGVVQNWVGAGVFESGTLTLYVRRMPAFFETFPVILIDQGGTVRADIPFRRAESRYSIEQVGVSLYFSGGILSGVGYSTPSIVKSYARKAQFGQIFTFDRRIAGSDGVYRTSSRGWYSFGHISFVLIFFFGHLWHAGRALFKDLWTGISTSYDTIASVEYGRNEKLGEFTTKTSAFL